MKNRVVYYTIGILALWLSPQQRQLQLFQFECRFPSLHNKDVQTLHTLQKITLSKRSAGSGTAAKAIRTSKGMKRFANLCQSICDLDNLRLADFRARKNKGHQTGVKSHQLNQEENLNTLKDLLLSKLYRTSEYTVSKIYEPKERDIFRLPYFPDRITHHAIINIIGPMLVSTFTRDTYSGIKERGIHAASFALRRALRNESETTYCLKLDIRKFYPSIDHGVLKTQLRAKFKDADLIWLLDEIIDSAPGLPIGNLLSQYFANFYLNGFDHWIKQDLRVKDYFRYADDVVILSNEKTLLHEHVHKIKDYLASRLALQVKGNYQVFPVSARGIDFVGYVHYHTYTRLRKSTKQNFARMLASRPSKESIASYRGWTKHCNSNHLIKTLFKNKNQSSWT